MPKMLLHDEAAREALGRGVAKLARALRGTLGPRGMNAFMDRPIGSPIVSRDGVSIAAEIELEDPFENMGVQVVREVSRQTNEVAGDGTTTATLLADALVQQGLAAIAKGANAVELVEGLAIGTEAAIAALNRSARDLDGPEQARAVASIAANDERLGAMVAEAFARVGADGIVDVQFGVGVDTALEIIDGMAFDRSYLSHHMVTDVERMQVVLDHPLILLTDHKIGGPDELAAALALSEKAKRPLLIIAEDIAPGAVIHLLTRRETSKRPIAAINPPEYGHWRKAMLEDIAIATGGRVIARDLGGRVDQVQLADLGGARQVRISANRTLITAGEGDEIAIAARREQVTRQWEAAPENIERDKFQERLAKLSGGTAVILAGGATPVEQKRRLQLIEDAINATRAAIAEGVVPGGGTALVRIAPELDELIGRQTGSTRTGVELLQCALAQPLLTIARNCGLDAAAQLKRVQKAKGAVGLDARTGELLDLATAGIMDPVKVATTALRNAASVAGLILTTDTLIAKQPEDFDPTAGPALGGGAEKLGRA
ncbi:MULTISPECIES: molecular chaperone GroEL [Rhodomicrobium]|uniref:molecular chaperone GroEL n=1 Tax=Rhodomicrobium TaxID=1068 RepID=UPI000B4ADC69|nr:MULTISPECIES: molecular chaperone GroEL [Rhodomicrobium]